MPADPILGLVAAFKADTAVRKVNLAQGAYRTDEGLPFILTSVQEAERRITEALVCHQSLDEVDHKPRSIDYDDRRSQSVIRIIFIVAFVDLVIEPRNEAC